MREWVTARDRARLRLMQSLMRVDSLAHLAVDERLLDARKVGIKAPGQGQDNLRGINLGLGVQT